VTPTGCNHNICATCSNISTCIEACHTGCATCDADNKCSSPKTTYYINGSGIAAKCEDGCDVCGSSGCTTATDGYFVESDGSVT
jgi:hypothetical protein